MDLGPFTIARSTDADQSLASLSTDGGQRLIAPNIAVKQLELSALSPSRDGWWPFVFETYTGAWQRNETPLELGTILTHPTVKACMDLIASDMGKMRIYLAEKREDGVWTETTNPAFSPVLKTPNRYQTRAQFTEWWITSLLEHGNTYVLKARDNRNVVTALYILDPNRVEVLVAPDGSVWYRLDPDDLSNVPEEMYTVPASEMIHDRYNPLFHPLIGVSPLQAAWMAAQQGKNIQNASTKFWARGGRPSGILTAPGALPQDKVDRMKTRWDTQLLGDPGGIAVLAGGLTYTPLAMTAAESQLTGQMEWLDLAICRTFGVPAYMVNVGPQPSYNNIEALNQQYYAQCLQRRVKHIELLLGAGMALPVPFGVKFDLSDLLRMDTQTKVNAAQAAIGAGFMSPNEARVWFDLPPVPGGDTPYLQVQNYSLAALDERDRLSPLAAEVERAQQPQASPQTADDDEPENEVTEEDVRSLEPLLRRALLDAEAA